MRAGSEVMHSDSFLMDAERRRFVEWHNLGLILILQNYFERQIQFFHLTELEEDHVECLLQAIDC